MLIFISGLALGGCVGYLIWKYINPASGEFNLTLKIISGVIALILGGAVTAVFPAASPGFAGWAIGILAGFAFILGKNAYGRWNVQREEAFQEEIQQMNAHWSAIDQFIQQKMQLRLTQIQPSVFEGTLSLEELKELNMDIRENSILDDLRVPG